MEDKAHLAYFLNRLKDELDFKDSLDFRNKIENSFDFRFKVQKFVFLAKYFGWDNSYKFALYPRGPYSSTLAKDYYSDLFGNKLLNVNEFNHDSFIEFVHGKSNYYLEATSTILFYKSFNHDFPLKTAISTLNEIKPHIDSKIVEDAYHDVNNLTMSVDAVVSDVSEEFLQNQKVVLINKIIKLEAIFNKFDLSNNSRFIVLSMDYLKSILINETLDNNVKNDFCDFILQYLSRIDEFLALSNAKAGVFEEMNINYLKDFFRLLENYMCHELNIRPRFDESDEANIHKIFEDYFTIHEFILSDIVPKHDCLVSCELYFQDEVGNPAFEYYIKSRSHLNYETRKKLTHEIILEVYDFCLSLNLEHTFKTISIFLVKRE